MAVESKVINEPVFLLKLGLEEAKYLRDLTQNHLSHDEESMHQRAIRESLFKAVESAKDY